MSVCGWRRLPAWRGGGLIALPIISDDQRPYSRDGLMLGFASDTPEALRAGARSLARLVSGQP